MRPLYAVLPVAAAAVATAALLTPPPAVEHTDFGAVRTRVEPAYHALLTPASRAPVKTFRIPITHESITIADGVTYEGWTFGGTVPGPVIRVRQGDLVRVTLVNQSPMPHSIDFHAARIAPNLAFTTIGPEEELTFEFTARDPGAYVVHCGTPPILLHIMNGMYLPIIVDPAGGWPGKADKEFVLVQSEFYAGDHVAGGVHSADFDAAIRKAATHVVFNGRAFQYKENPLQVDVGDRVRLFVLNAGPSLRSDFHVVGAVFDRVYPGGDPRQTVSAVQTWVVPAGGGAVFETVFEADASGTGTYPFVTHAFADASLGAVGLIRVGNPATSMAH
jgi:nitrite reductase (NO-forming)